MSTSWITSILLNELKIIAPSGDMKNKELKERRKKEKFLKEIKDQEAIATIKTFDIGLPIEFINFRD